MTIRSDKRRFRPFGLFGGCEGSDSLCVINLGGKDEVVLPVLLAEPFQLESGDMYRHVLASGGGCGAPYESDLNDVLNEVVLWLVTVEGAGSTMARRSLAPTELLPLIMRPRPLATEREGYPMPFRLRAKAQRFDRWDIIRTRWRNTEPKDMRTESKRIDHESLVKVRELKKSERHEFACYAIAESLSEENEKRRSFARIRPEDPEFIIQPLGDATKEENQRPRDTLLSQTDMFSGDSTVLTSEIARHSFHYLLLPPKDRTGITGLNVLR